MNKLKTFLAIFYYLLPRVVREQYSDTLVFYKAVFKHNFQKLTGKSEDLSISLVQSINLLGATTKTLYQSNNRSSHIKSPNLYIDGEHFYRKELKGSIPDISISLIEDIDVIGTTDAIIHKDKMYHNELNSMKQYHDLKRFDIFSPIEKNKYELTVLEDVINASNETIYISLLKEHSSNYYHFVTEALPRLISILNVIEKDDNLIDQTFILLIDYEVPAQCINIVNMLINPNFSIEFVKHGHRVHCKKLIYCTPLWISLDNTTSLPNPLEEFFVDREAIELVHTALHKDLSENKQIRKPYRKIYLQRLNNKLRPIINIIEVEKLFYKHDFEFIDTTHMSIKEQYDLFSEASLVLGASGASFTNILFMQKGTTAVTLYPSTQSTNYYIFQPLADTADINLIHFLTDPLEDQVSLHAPSSIDLQNLDKLLKDIT